MRHSLGTKQEHLLGCLHQENLGLGWWTYMAPAPSQLPFRSVFWFWHKVSPMSIPVPHIHSLSPCLITRSSSQSAGLFFWHSVASLAVQTVKSYLFSETSSELWCEKQGRAEVGRDISSGRVQLEHRRQ